MIKIFSLEKVRFTDKISLSLVIDTFADDILSLGINSDC